MFPTKLFKIFNKALSRPLTNLINISFVKAVLPSVLKNTSFYPYQFGFNTDHLTDSAFIETAEQIRKAHGKGLFACRVYLDLKKTFHTVNHNIPLTKPEHYSTLKPIIGFLHS